MAGLLGWAKEGFSKSYFTRAAELEEQKRRQEFLTGLLGQAPTMEPNTPGVASYGLVDPNAAQTTPPVLNQETASGTGLLGGEYDFGGYLARASAHPAFFDPSTRNMTSMVNQDSANVAAMQRQQAGDMAAMQRQQMMTPLDQARILQAEAAAQRSQQGIGLDQQAAARAQNTAELGAALAWAKHYEAQTRGDTTFDTRAQTLEYDLASTLENEGLSQENWQNHQNPNLDIQMLGALASIIDPVGAISDESVEQGLRSMGFTQAMITKMQNVDKGVGILDPTTRLKMMQSINARVQVSKDRAASLGAQAMEVQRYFPGISYQQLFGRKPDIYGPKDLADPLPEASQLTIIPGT
jgi:hypothetical protein